MRKTTTLGCSRTSARLSVKSSRTYSTYASSIAIRICGGTDSTNRRSSAGRTTVPVGLLGLQTKISRVTSVTAAAMAARS
ncbi:Uncharacterised protein [Mycobacteroides abscessus subsp. abscessus]|nr:Uncharacterised protein [Mycobacteroides abscessus subsp. abscessus]